MVPVTHEQILLDEMVQGGVEIKLKGGSYLLDGHERGGLSGGKRLQDPAIEELLVFREPLEPGLPQRSGRIQAAFKACSIIACASPSTGPAFPCPDTWANMPLLDRMIRLPVAGRSRGRFKQ
jgi:hypothetical protein